MNRRIARKIVKKFMTDQCNQVADLCLYHGKKTRIKTYGDWKHLPTSIVIQGGESHG